jgi:hypothetical protein
VPCLGSVSAAATHLGNNTCGRLGACVQGAGAHWSEVPTCWAAGVLGRPAQRLEVVEGCHPQALQAAGQLVSILIQAMPPAALWPVLQGTVWTAAVQLLGGCPGTRWQ